MSCAVCATVEEALERELHEVHIALEGLDAGADVDEGVFEDVDEGALKQYQRNARRHNRKIEKQLDELDSWPGKLKAAAAKVSSATTPAL